MSLTWAEQMAEFAIAIARAKPGVIVPVPHGATQADIGWATDMAEQLKAEKSRLLYELQADGIY